MLCRPRRSGAASSKASRITGPPTSRFTAHAGRSGMLNRLKSAMMNRRGAGERAAAVSGWMAAKGQGRLRRAMRSRLAAGPGGGEFVVASEV